MTTKPNTDLGRRLREARRKAHLTQAEAGARAGVGQGRFSEYETGATTPDIKTLRRLAAALRVSLCRLL